MTRRVSVVLLVGFCSTVVYAAAIPPAGFLNQVVLCDTNNTHCSTLSQSNNPSQTYSNSFLVNGTAINFSGNDQVQPGILKSLAHFDTAIAQTFYTQFQVVGQVFEDFTFGGGTPGTVAYVSPTFSVTGTSTGPAAAVMGVFYVDSTDGVSHQLPLQFFPGNMTVTFDRIPYHYGSPIMIAFAFGSVVFPQGSLSGTADFSHTSVLSGLPTFADADLSHTTPLSNTTIASSSGTSYSANGIVPEPGTWGLLGAGLAALAMLRRRLVSGQRIF